MSKDLDFRERSWGTADGRRVRLKEMELGHLVNVLNWVHDHNGVYGNSIKEALVKEAEYRRVFAFANGESYAGLLEGRWKVIDPTTGKGSIIKPSDEYLEAVKDNPVYQRMSEWVQAKRQDKSRINRG